MPSDGDFPAELGAWDPSELRKTHRDSSGAGSDSDVRPEIRFVRGVARLVRNREARDGARNDPKKLSIFLLAPRAGEKHGLKRVPMLDNGRTPIAGNAWFVGPAVRAGWPQSLDIDPDDDDAAFRLITDDLEWGDVPTVVVDPRLSEISVRHYPCGLNDVDNCDLVNIHGDNIALDEVLDLIDRVHEKSLVTPDALPDGARLWRNPQRFWPEEDAEHRVQALLKLALLGRFVTCEVQHESRGVAGRVDLRLDEMNPLDRGNWVHLVLLELKVLRSFGSTGRTYSEQKVQDAVQSGVKQAAAYRAEHGHREAALCCFDMRRDDRGDECFSSVKDMAASMEISLRRWYLYASSKHYRDALVQQVQGQSRA